MLIVDEAQNILDLEGLAIIDDWVEGGIAEEGGEFSSMITLSQNSAKDMIRIATMS